MSDEWKFRPGTLDRAIFNGVVYLNEYQLPSLFGLDDVVIDIGTHIGSFAHAAASRGCHHVYSVEPDAANLEIASQNLRSYIANGDVKLLRGAVWRSDSNDDQLRFDGYHAFPNSHVELAGILNTGNGSVIWGVGNPVEKIAFDDLVDMATNSRRRRIRLLKLDCEGAEWPILLTSQRLHFIDEICGEFHEIGGEYLEISEGREVGEPIFRYAGASLTINLLIKCLIDAGFRVDYQRHRRPSGALEGLGLFFARRTEKLAEGLR
ncbi:MAG TPA: FkbM family methyltransferase [Pyrinomonadaceae bacterium]|nr:FkbM family methyltransferase [Pyrinomonadaceae bacterium]